VNLPVDSGRRGHDGLCDENAGVNRDCSGRPTRSIYHGLVGADASHHNLQTRKLRMARQSITLDYSRRNWLFECCQGLRLRHCQITSYHPNLADLAATGEPKLTNAFAG